jgi:hypothetical protein
MSFLATLEICKILVKCRCASFKIIPNCSNMEIWLLTNHHRFIKILEIWDFLHIKHINKFPRVFGRNLILMNIRLLRKKEGWYTHYLNMGGIVCVRSLTILRSTPTFGYTSWFAYI